MDVLGLGRAHRRTGTDTPVAVLSRTFPVDTTLSDLWTFLRDSLGQASLTAEELMGIDTTVANALTEVDEDTKAVTVSLRVYPHSIEVEVLLSNVPADTSGGVRVTHGSRRTSYRRRPNSQRS